MKILKAELLLPHLHLMWTEYSRLLTQPANITERSIVEGRSMVNIISVARETWIILRFLTIH